LRPPLPCLRSDSALYLYLYLNLNLSLDLALPLQHHLLRRAVVAGGEPDEVHAVGKAAAMVIGAVPGYAVRSTVLARRASAAGPERRKKVMFR